VAGNGRDGRDPGGAIYDEVTDGSGSGIWSTLHEARIDVSMLLGLTFLAMAGGGSSAVDDRLHLRAA
jgi:hypothetical protein